MTLLCGCPERFPEWDDQDIDLGGTLVHRLPIPNLMHMPLAYGFYVGRQQQMINQLGLAERRPGLLLTRTGIFRDSITRLMENARSPARNLHVLPRPYWVYAVLHHGNLSTGHKVIQQMQARIVDAGRQPRELYLGYLNCQQCAEKKSYSSVTGRRVRSCSGGAKVTGESTPCAINCFIFQPFLASFFIWLLVAHLAEIARCLRGCRAQCVRTARQWRDSGLASLADMRRRDRLVSPAASHPYY